MSVLYLRGEKLPTQQFLRQCYTVDSLLKHCLFVFLLLCLFPSLRGVVYAIDSTSSYFAEKKNNLESASQE